MPHYQESEPRPKDAANDDVVATGRKRHVSIGLGDHNRVCIAHAIDFFKNKGEEEESNCGECCATHAWLVSSPDPSLVFPYDGKREGSA